MYLHGLMVMAKNVADHRLVADLLTQHTEGRSFFGERKSTEIWCFSCGGDSKKFEQKLSKSDENDAKLIVVGQNQHFV